mmetsp:Transcript_21199/g.53550  ORF Transcript_21199/g.53550 Transcript_21199/m.53550 type:complete len:141 (-) Transcript_21199:262-684(-)
MQTTGARIVLSSTWRTQAKSFAMVDQLLKQLRLAPIYDRTKDLTKHMRRHIPREVEVCEWLDRHPGVLRWIAIDDMDLAAGPSKEASRLRGHFVHTSSNVGLTKKDAELAVNLMNRQAEKNALRDEHTIELARHRLGITR